MRIDALVSFLLPGSSLSLVGGAGVDFASNVIDLLGSGEGTTPANIFGTPTLFGTDLGIGGQKAQIEATIGTALVTATSATLNVAFQAAPDTAVTHLAGTWQTLVETGELTAAQCIANAVIARFDYPPAFPVNLRPRYIRLLFQVPAGALFTAGTIANALVVPLRDDLGMLQAAKNYVVS